MATSTWQSKLSKTVHLISFETPAEKELIEAVEKALTVSSDLKFQAEKLAYDRKRFDSLTDREKDVVILSARA